MPRQEQTHPQAEEEEGDERVERFQKGQVEGRTGKDHHQQQGHKAEHAVHHGKAALFQREDILGDIHLFQQGAALSTLLMLEEVASLKKLKSS